MLTTSKVLSSIADFYILRVLIVMVVYQCSCVGVLKDIIMLMW
ncbi:hypothetical protein KN1_00370 [Stygiolobus caldivivus]|uniref:Uncharacterized protein n=1 Tax=Stygiolobus caldivivus TaxID=2824673 RepID=A0A8D5U3I2_9CREN|nr:hypothetical protein KN1_00370 [Stygiolobus caldivivus]